MGEIMKTKALITVVGCVVGSTLMLSPAIAEQGPQAERPVTTESIPGVVAAGMRVEHVWKGLRAADVRFIFRTSSFLIRKVAVPH